MTHPVLGKLSAKPISGEALARALKVTRAAVWKQIRALQALGFPIRSHAKRGYSVDVSSPFSLLNPHFSTPLSHWAKLHLELSTASTQILAKRAAHSGVPEGHFWVSEVQTQGRGRLGRQWNSGFGGLWFSLILRPQVPPSRASSIGMLAALTLAETIQAVTRQKTYLKWPNDIVLKANLHSVLCNQPQHSKFSSESRSQRLITECRVQSNNPWRKVAGFLTEMSGEMGKTEWIVLGVGLNVHNRLPESLGGVATALSEHSQTTISRETLLADFLKRFQGAYRTWQREGFEAYRQPYWKRYFQPDQRVQLRTGSGMIRGLARSVDPSGAIIVESRRRNRAVLEGDIILS